MNKTLIILFIFITNNSFSETHLSDLPPTYTITKSEKLNTLKSTEAIFEFTFNVWNQGPTKPNIQLSYNGINKIATYNKCGKYLVNVKPGKYIFKFFATGGYYEITTDSIEIKPGFVTEINITFQSAIHIQYTKKPVIYVYPKESTQVKITLDLKGEFNFTYPEYNKGWNFTAEPNGTISMNGPEGTRKKYDYLFWDGKLNLEMNKINWSDGYIVKKEDQVKFFEDKLSQMGLSPREIEDFITYWVPIMNANKENYIHFLFNEDYNEYATMNVTPKPDKVFRVNMLWSNADGNQMLIVDQKLQTFYRSGFTVVEWGGTELQKIPHVGDVGFWVWGNRSDHFVADINF